MLYSENVHFTREGFVFTDRTGKPLTFFTALDKVFSRMANWYYDLRLAKIHYFSEHCIFWFLRRIVFRLAGLKIGSTSKIHMGVRFFLPSGITIGEDSVIGFSAFLDGRDKLFIGNHVDIASEVMIYNSEHDVTDENFAVRCEPVEIADYVFVGPRAIILPGVKIGRGAVIAAGAVVTKNVEPCTIVAGVPAKVIGERKLKDLNYKLGRTRLFQ